MKIFKHHLFAILWFVFYITAQLFVVFAGTIVSLLFDKEFIQMFNTGKNYNLDTIIWERVTSVSLMAMPIVSIFIIIIFFIILLIKNTKEMLNLIRIDRLLKYISFGIWINLFLNIIIAFLPLSKYVSELNNSIETILTGNFLFVLFSTGIVVPIMEEIIFRYGICHNLSKLNKYYGLILSSLIFGVMHGNLIQGTYAFLLGMIFGYIDEKEKNLLPSIIMHISINSLTVIIAFTTPFTALIIVLTLFCLITISKKISN